MFWDAWDESGDLTLISSKITSIPLGEFCKRNGNRTEQDPDGGSHLLARSIRNEILYGLYVRAYLWKGLFQNVAAKRATRELL